MVSVLEFHDYKAYLRKLENSDSVTRGFRTRLAEAASCQSAFISQVLNSSAHLSLEQGLGIAGFLRLSAQERKYFLWLIEYGRAGTVELRSFFETLLQREREAHLDIKKRVGPKIALTQESKAIYYSQWYYSAIHMAVTIPQLSTRRQLTAALELGPDVIENAVDFLISTGLVQEKQGRLTVGKTHIHLDREEPMIYNHHANWRMAALRAFSNPKPTSVHYSTVSSLSAKDAEDLRAKMITFIESYVAQVRPSQEEVLYSFNIDFFGLTK
ncbi:MAG: TIGR02147 family protein [Bdellovibrionota bacterium]